MAGQALHYVNTLHKANRLPERAVVAMDKNKPILVNVESHKGDKYGRILATVWCDGQDLAQQLILNGHGVPYDGGKKGTIELPPKGE